GELPELAGEISELTAECQLEAGPFESAAAYYSSQPSPRAWLEAGRAWQRAGHPVRALNEVERVLASANCSDSLRVRARALRAELVERAGDPTLALSDYRWLALEAARPGADATYERLASAPLTKRERLRRAQGLAERGNVEAVTRELERLKYAPGASPPLAALRRCRARAHYRSRSDYRKAAQLYEQAARHDTGPVSDWMSAAEAWSRGRQVGRAARLYREIVRRHPSGSVAERARYALAQLYFSHGRWEEADRAYTRYLERYARPGRRPRGRHLNASHYERAIARLAAGHAEGALGDISALRRRGRSGYSAALLRHLEGVALSASRSPAERALGVRRFRDVIRDYPLSFAALASSARLKRLGRPGAHLKPRPALALTASPFELPARVRLLADLGLYTAAEGALYAAAPAQLRQYSPRAGQALCQQYASLDRGFRRFELARRIVRRNLLRGLPNPDNIWAWECLHPRPYNEATAAFEASYDLPSGLLHAVMRHESEFRPDARSPAGAIGLMQLMPATAQRAARELALPYDRDRLEQPQYNLQLGAFYLGKLLDSFDQRVALALAGYNAGPHAVSRWLDGIGNLDLDLWVARIPYRETRNYVQRVMSSWARYRYLDQGPGAVPDLALRVPPHGQLTAGSY
ncbi:MAG: transglycosylase SLT domain-containing protein, partial [Deltaproteobacteria bacterium]